MVSQETRDKRSASMRAYWAKPENRQRLLSAMGVSPDAWTEEDDATLRRLKGERKPDNVIAAALERTSVAVRDRLKRLRKRGWTP